MVFFFFFLQHEKSRQIKQFRVVFLNAGIKKALTHSLHDFIKFLIAHHLPSPVIVSRHCGVVSEAVCCVSEGRNDPRLALLYLE